MLDLTRDEVSVKRLRRGDPVHFAPDACLIVRRAGSECGVCRDACPSGVLSGGEWSIALESDGCVGCGLCAAACPTGALRVEWCTPNPLHVPGGTLALECGRVAQADRDPNALTVPCLGGLVTPYLLDLIDTTDKAVVLIDRGWCSDCAVGRCAAPWQNVFDETTALFGTIDEGLADELVVERRELPLDKAQATFAALRPDRKVGRRDFLRRLIGAVEPRGAAAESRQVVLGRGHVLPLKRKHILARISALAGDLDLPLPPSLMPAIKISEGCELDGLCAAICPTGALRREFNSEAVSLEFHAANCIACGLCQRACTNKALSLWPQGDGSAPHDTQTLVTRRTATCPSCSDAFVSTGDEQSCPNCQKTETLMRELSSLKFG